MTQDLVAVHIVEGEAPPSTDVMQRMFADVDAFNRKLQQASACVFAGGVQPVAASTVVRRGAPRCDSSCDGTPETPTPPAPV